MTDPFNCPVGQGDPSNTICAFFLRKQCKFGDACKFSHSANLNAEKTVPICRYFLDGSCRYSKFCMFSHPGENSTQVNLGLSLAAKLSNCSNQLTATVSNLVNYRPPLVATSELQALARKRAEDAQKLREYEKNLEKYPSPARPSTPDPQRRKKRKRRRHKIRKFSSRSPKRRKSSERREDASSSLKTTEKLSCTNSESDSKAPFILPFGLPPPSQVLGHGRSNEISGTLV